MADKIQFYRSSGLPLRYAAVACLLLCSGATSVFAQDQQSAYTLTAGRPVAREIRGGEEHKYQVTLSAGQYARVVLEQKGIDVVVALLDAGGKPILQVDNNVSGTRGLEIVSLLAEVSGVYGVNVQSLEKGASLGRYELRIEDLRIATNADRIQMAAERSYFAGVELQSKRNSESRRQALEKYAEALPLMRQAGDRRGEAMTLTNIGTTYNALSEPQKAVDPLDQALAIWRALGDRHLEAVTLSVKSRVYNGLGDPQKALESYSLALPVVRAVQDQSAEAVTLIQIGSIYSQFGELQKALDHFAQALPVLRAVGTRRNEAALLNNIATVYNLLGERQTALQYFQQVIPLARAEKDRGLEAVALNNMAHVHNVLVQPKEALEQLDQALKLVREVGDRKVEAAVLTNMGTAYAYLEDRPKAVDFLDRGLQLRVEVKDRQGEAVTLSHLGRAYDRWREPKKAFEYHEKALPIWRALGDRNGEVAALYGMARAESRLDDLSGARRRTEEALAITNTLRTKVASLDLRASYFASVQDLYKLHIDLLMRLHRRQPTEGFDVAALKAYEQARARSLIDMLAEANADIREGADPALLARERSLQQMLNVEAQRQMRVLAGQPTKEAATAAQRRIDEVLTQLLAIEAELKADSPHYAALTQPVPLGLTEIQSAVTDDSTLLLEYSLGEERSYLWAVTATSFSSYELPSRAVIEAAARRCYDLLTARNQYVKFETADEKRKRVQQADSEYPGAATALSEMLLGPVARDLGRKRLLIVPDGALEYLPFAALTVPRQVAGDARRSRQGFVPLMVEHEVTSIPSASTLAVLRQQLKGRVPADKVVAVFADPVFDKADKRVTGAFSRNGGGHHRGFDTQEPSPPSNDVPALQRLPYTRQEADAILALVPATGRKAALGFEANRSAAMAGDLVKYRIIHFATHSYLDSTNPKLSSIALSMLDREGRSQNGYLRAHEVFNLRLAAELVVLSGCRTGLGKEVKGEGLYGMTRGFMYAGAKRVVVSLWDVQDQATARLMSDFYRELIGAKRAAPPAALRAAQIAIWRDGRWQAPYYWAGFVLQGEPR